MRCCNYISRNCSKHVDYSALYTYIRTLDQPSSWKTLRCSVFVEGRLGKSAYMSMRKQVILLS